MTALIVKADVSGLVEAMQALANKPGPDAALRLLSALRPFKDDPLADIAKDIAALVRSLPMQARKGYPEFNPDEPRDTVGRWTDSGGGPPTTLPRAAIAGLGSMSRAVEDLKKPDGSTGGFISAVGNGLSRAGRAIANAWHSLDGETQSNIIKMLTSVILITSVLLVFKYASAPEPANWFERGFVNIVNFIRDNTPVPPQWPFPWRREP